MPSNTQIQLGKPAAIEELGRLVADGQLRPCESVVHGIKAAPCVADFAVYHPLWFSRRRVPVMAGILDATPVVLAWLDRMEAIGHGQFGKLSAAQAIALCADAVGPAALVDSFFQDEHGIPLGSRVTVAAESFGPEPTEGELLAATRTRYTLRRIDERAGLVHVHFPRMGFTLKPAPGA